MTGTKKKYTHAQLDSSKHIKLLFKRSNTSML